MILKITTIDQAKLRLLLDFLKPLFKKRFPDQKNTKFGPKRKFSRWLLVILGLLGAHVDMSWKEYIVQLQPMKDMILSFNQPERADTEVEKLPAKTTIYKAAYSVPPSQIMSLTHQIARIMVDAPSNVSVDSSGFLLKLGSIWRTVKYTGTRFKRTSRIFYKIHIVVDTATKTVLALNWSKSPTHDFPMALKLLRQLGKRLLAKVTRFFGDKAYGGSALRKQLAAAGVDLIVEPKSNAIDSGQDTARDRQVRLYQASPKLWKHTFGHGRKSVVESVFSEIKLKMRFKARKRVILKRQLLLQFFMFNLNLWLDSHKSRR